MPSEKSFCAELSLDPIAQELSLELRGHLLNSGAPLLW